MLTLVEPFFGKFNCSLICFEMHETFALKRQKAVFRKGQVF